MPTEVVMPQMGESIAEGTITRWLVKVGDKVERDQPLFEISTDKVDAEIPSPVAGVLKEIKAEEGATVPVNEVVAMVEEEGAGDGDAAPADDEKADDQAETDEKAASEDEEPDAEAKADDDGEDEGDEKAAASAAEASDDGAEPGSEEERLRRYSSPLVRKIAQEEGVDLTKVEGTGVHGRVTKQDILGYIETRGDEPETPAEKPAAAKPAEKPSAAPAPSPRAAAADGFHVPAYTEGEEVEIEPMSKIRQITAAHMTYSKATSAHVTTVFHVDFSRVARVRARAKNRFNEAQGTKLTYMPFVFKALASALKKHKQLNAAIDGTNIVYKKHVNIGMAVDVEGRGLLVPVIRDADQLSLAGLAKTANDLAERARSKKLSPDALRGGTFTVTNPGVFGSLFGTPIINQPQVAIVGIGAIEKRPVVTSDANGNDAISIKTMCYLSITYDHRLVDGADADRFMIDVKKVIEEDSWGELQGYM
ncbi:MAG TPA: 2-oxoglutarate dehydrogenase, E2 component, dihydrolipoamide succinyltransferase [Thermoanaerobaculia bacterium]|nr:2-oxoglutarate dehydrogenase, E2 component, dihydrolipoamide succinyltransferase [Thermoanaerobaculia bacterium]